MDFDETALAHSTICGMGLADQLQIFGEARSCGSFPNTASVLQERMKARRVLITTDGPKDNVLKMKPPLVFSKANVDHFMGQLRAVLAEDMPSADMALLLQPWSLALGAHGGPPKRAAGAPAPRELHGAEEAAVKRVKIG